MAEAADVANLARKLRGKGLSDDQVKESLTGLGYTKTEAGQAITAIGPTAAPAAPTKKAPRKGGRTTRATPPPPKTGAAVDEPAAPPPAAGSSGAGGGIGMPKLELPSPTLTPPRRLSSGDLGGFAAGLLLYTLALNYMRYGSEGVSGWLRAKFLNQPADVDAPARRAAAGDRKTTRRPDQSPGFGPVSDRTTTRPQRPKEV